MAYYTLPMGSESMGQYGATGHSLWNTFVAIFSVQSEVGGILGLRSITIF